MFKNNEFLRVLGLMRPRTVKYFFSIIMGCALDSMMFQVMAYVMVFLVKAVETRDSLYILHAALSMGAAALISGLLSPIFFYSYGKCVRQTTSEIRQRVFKKVECLKMGYFDANHSGDLVSRVTNDVSNFDNLFGDYIAALTWFLVSGISCSIVMLVLNFKFAILMIVIGFITVFLNRALSKPVRALSNTIQKKNSLVTEKLIDMFSGLHIIKLYNKEDAFLGNYQNLTGELSAHSVKLSFRKSLLNMANVFMASLTNNLALAIGVFFVINDQLELGKLLAMVQLLHFVVNMFTFVGDFVGKVQSAMGGIARVFELLDQEEEPIKYTLPIEKDVDKEILLKDVVFKFDDEKEILKGMSFSVKKGQTAAFVGTSGGGKSTIIKILMGFYPIESGNIWIQGKSFSSYSLQEIREKISYVSQDTYLFHGTIFENISHGKPGATAEEVESAAKLAYAHDFIMEFQHGYNTIVGERGARLSGGQRQRIAIARAFLKNSSIILLDEATSALDSESQQQVQTALDSLMKNRTTIMVAHRLLTVENADKIFFIKDGTVIEEGTHNELLSLTGAYYDLYKTSV